MKEAFELHVAQDAENFATINDKLDALALDMAVVKTQWKMVGIFVGGLSSIIGLVAATLLGSCG